MTVLRYCAKVGLRKNQYELLSASISLDALPAQKSIVGKAVISPELRKAIHSELSPKLLQAIHTFRESRRLDALTEIVVAIANDHPVTGIETQHDSGESLPDWQPQEPDGSFERLILPVSTLGCIEQAVISVKAAAKVFDDWGFRQNFHGRRPACILNFYGPPGTGKTATANALARRLGVPILVANYSQIESKYVGDSAKNLDSLFAQAQQTGALLLFDEADILLSRRVTSQSSSDHALNALRTSMLLWLERFSGVCVLATNNRESYDRAFDRRILFDVPFTFPSETERMQILSAHLPKQAPLARGVDLPSVAKLLTDFSGADIRDMVLRAALAACQDDADTIQYRHFEIASVQIQSARQRDDQRNWFAERAQGVSARLADGQ